MFDQVTMKRHQIFNSYTDTQNVKRSLDMKETAVSISSIPLCIMVTSKSTKYWTVLFQNNREEREPADLKTLTNKQTALLLWMLWNDWHENREGRTLSFKGPLTKYHHSQTSCWMDNIDIFQQTSSIAACHAWAHTSISDFFLISNLFFSPLTYLKVLYCIIINGFSLEQTIFATTTKKHTETTFHSYFFLTR